MWICQGLWAFGQKPKVKQRQSPFGVSILVTKGQRRLGRTIRKLENSVEFSAKESLASAEERSYRQRVHPSTAPSDNSPVQDLRDLATRRIDHEPRGS